MNDIKEKINSLIPWYDCNLPFSKESVSFTPFRVKDAKNISIILQEKNSIIGLKSLIEVLKNNTNYKKIDELCLADAEYLFLQIRSKSVEEQLNLIVDGEPFKININDIKFKNNIVKDTIIDHGNLHVTIETPSLKKLLNVDINDKFSYYKSTIKNVIFKNEYFDLEKFLPEELQEIIENLPAVFLKKIQNIKHPELYVNLSKEGKESEVSGRLTFFTFL